MKWFVAMYDMTVALATTSGMTITYRLCQPARTPSAVQQASAPSVSSLARRRLRFANDRMYLDWIQSTTWLWKREPVGEEERAGPVARARGEAGDEAGGRRLLVALEGAEAVGVRVALVGLRVVHLVVPHPPQAPATLRRARTRGSRGTSGAGSRRPSSRGAPRGRGSPSRRSTRR